MHLDLTEEQALIRDAARRLSDTEFAPVAGDLESSDKRPLNLARLRQPACLGFMGLNVDDEYGGTDAGMGAFSVAIAEIARVTSIFKGTSEIQRVIYSRELPKGVS